MLALPDLAAATQPVAGRSCGTCTMCCKLFNIPEIPKPAGKWCSHCRPGKGCRIYETRPRTCREFFCGWMVSGTLGPEWKPDRCKIVLQFQAVNGTYWLTAHVDESYPAAWRRPDLYRRLKDIAAANPAIGNRVGLLVAVRIGPRHILIQPHRELDLGVLAEGEEFAVSACEGELDIRKVKRGSAPPLQ